MASDVARRSSDNFCETYGDSALDSIAPFERDEIILGRRVGLGTFSSVYEIQAFNLRPSQSDKYTEEQVQKREATAKSMKNGARYVMKCLKTEVEDSDDHDEDLFLDAAHDIVHEAEMLAALSHPNIVKLHGVTASRHDAFLDGASEFFIILERLESTLVDKIKVWAKDKNSFNPSKSSMSLKSLSRSLSSTSLRSLSSSSLHRSFSSCAVTTSADEEGSLDNRLRVAASLACALEYLHSQGAIFHDLKPANVGFDKQGNLMLFDFGLARFMPKCGDAYKEVYEMSGAGTPRYNAPEVFFDQPYNLKADVYSYSVMLWELVCLKKPFAKYKYRKEFEKALLKVDKTLVMNRRWPQTIQDIIKKGSSSDHLERPTMSEVCKALDDISSMTRGAEDCDKERSATPFTADSFQEFLEDVDQTLTF
jgi:serine/threonine protein kinase